MLLLLLCCCRNNIVSVSGLVYAATAVIRWLLPARGGGAVVGGGDAPFIGRSTLPDASLKKEGRQKGEMLSLSLGWGKAGQARTKGHLRPREAKGEKEAVRCVCIFSWPQKELGFEYNNPFFHDVMLPQHREQSGMFGFEEGGKCECPFDVGTVVVSCVSFRSTTKQSLS